jgi:hypothetical protein
MAREQGDAVSVIRAAAEINRMLGFYGVSEVAAAPVDKKTR